MTKELAVIFLKRETVVGNLSASVSQERLKDGDGFLDALVQRLGRAGSRKIRGTRESIKACRPGLI